MTVTHTCVLCHCGTYAPLAKCCHAATAADAAARHSKRSVKCAARCHDFREGFDPCGGICQVLRDEGIVARKLAEKLEISDRWYPR